MLSKLELHVSSKKIYITSSTEIRLWKSIQMSSSKTNLMRFALNLIKKKMHVSMMIKLMGYSSINSTRMTTFYLIAIQQFHGNFLTTLNRL